MDSLNHQSHDPLYRQLARRLVNQIKSDRYDAGQKIPSIRQLAEQYDVSTITVVRALDELRKQQYIYSVQGKGNFVAHHKIIQKFMPTQDGFTDMAEKAGLESSSIVLRKVIQTAGYQMGKEFSIDPEGELVLLERVRLLDGCPLCIQVSFLPHDLCYGILDYDFTKYSLYQVLREFFHVFMAKSQYNIQAGLAEERELQHLDLEAPSAILWVQHWAFNSSGRLFEFGKSAYRADCFQIKSPINEYEITSEFNA